MSFLRGAGGNSDFNILGGNGLPPLMGDAYDWMKKALIPLDGATLYDVVSFLHRDKGLFFDSLGRPTFRMDVDRSSYSLDRWDDGFVFKTSHGGAAFLMPKNIKPLNPAFVDSLIIKFVGGRDTIDSAENEFKKAGQWTGNMKLAASVYDHQDFRLTIMSYLELGSSDAIGFIPPIKRQVYFTSSIKDPKTSKDRITLEIMGLMKPVMEKTGHIDIRLSMLDPPHKSTVFDLDEEKNSQMLKKMIAPRGSR